MPRKTRSPARALREAGRRARNREAVEGRIVTAALALFQEKGFDATTTKAIARRARVAEGTVFNYFETKEDIALYFFGLEVDHGIAAVRGNPKLRHARLEETLFALVEGQLAFLAPHEKFIGAAIIHALRPHSKIAFGGQAFALRTRYLAFVQELIDEAASRGARNLFGWFAPQVFWIYYLGVLLYWLNDDSKGKANTLALLDRSLKAGVALLRKGKV